MELGRSVGLSPSAPAHPSPKTESSVEDVRTGMRPGRYHLIPILILPRILTCIWQKAWQAPDKGGWYHRNLDAVSICVGNSISETGNNKSLQQISRLAAVVHVYRQHIVYILQ